MEYYFYIIIVLIVLKVAIWSCVIYYRSQRCRSARAQRRFVVVDSRSAGPRVPSMHPPYHGHTNIPPNRHNHNDRSAIVDFEQPPAMSQGPPPYAQVVSQQAPPSYGNVMNAQGAEYRTPVPPHFTPPPEEAKY